jgi:hypothetical protein
MNPDMVDTMIQMFYETPIRENHVQPLRQMLGNWDTQADRNFKKADVLFRMCYTSIQGHLDPRYNKALPNVGSLFLFLLISIE